MAGFDAARRAALMSDLLGQVAGKPTDLLPFDAIRREFGLRHLLDRGIQQVALDLIVGSLGRTTEFNRAFLPRDESLRGRWEEIKDLAEGQRGFPPVELYQVGHAFFVVDGHHRVSVARAVGSRSIEARVSEFVTPIPLERDDSLEDVLLRHGLAGFLEATGLTPDDPNDFRVTVANGYERLLEHIRVHGYYRGLESGRDLPWEEEVASWRDNVYRPMIGIIRASGILEEFPGRTEIDLYLFTMDHLHHLRQRFQDPGLSAVAAVEHFETTVAAPQRGWRARLRQLAARFGGRFTGRRARQHSGPPTKPESES
jgi:hypothetical protein